MEQWKALKNLTETVDVTLPDAERHTVHHRSVSGEFRVFVPHHRDGRPYLGSAVAPLGPDEWKPDQARWAAALDEARAVADPWYPLDLPTTPLPDSRTSTMEKQELERWVEPMAEVIQQALAGEPVLPLREHLRFERHLVQYRDSLGNERDSVRHSAWLEVLLVPRDVPESHPFTAELRFSEFAPEVIAGFVRDQARLTLAAHQAKAWDPDGDFQVLLRGAALTAIFDFLLVHLGAPALAAGVSSLSLGQPLWNLAPREPLTLTALADLYNSPEPGSFDEEGIVLQPRTLVKDGRVRSFWSTQATSHWLGLPLTGRPRNYSISPGSATWASLRGQRILEVHRLRWAEVDPATGDFAAEVGLADWHERGRRPVFGVTLQGNLRDVLTNGLFSSEVASWEHFEGPEFLVVPAPVLRRS